MAPCLPATFAFRIEFPSAPSCFLFLLTSELYSVTSREGAQSDGHLFSCLMLLCWDQTQDFVCNCRLSATEPWPWPGSRFLVLEPSDPVLFALDFSVC